MILHVNAIEAVWVALNLTTLVLTVSALLAAWGDRAAVKLLNGHARELAATGIVRREAFRVIVQALLLAAVVPSVFAPGEADLHPTTLVLMAVPVVLLASSLLDARARGVMTVMVAADMLRDRNAGIARIERQNADLASAVHENTRITQKASDNADSAYQEAAHVSETAAATAETIVHTAEQVDDIHHATVEGK